jgi:hypothetical protein
MSAIVLTIKFASLFWVLVTLEFETPALDTESVVKQLPPPSHTKELPAIIFNVESNTFI